MYSMERHAGKAHSKMFQGTTKSGNACDEPATLPLPSSNKQLFKLVGWNRPAFLFHSVFVGHFQTQQARRVSPHSHVYIHSLMSGGRCKARS